MILGCSGNSIPKKISLHPRCEEKDIPDAVRTTSSMKNPNQRRLRHKMY